MSELFDVMTAVQNVALQGMRSGQEIGRIESERAMKALRDEVADLRSELQIAVNECCNDYWNKGHGQRVEEKYGITLESDGR